MGYWELLRRNSTFRKLWFADVVSLMGDWFTSIALFAMLLEFTGKGEAVGLAIITRLLPGLFFSPLSGVVADRCNRKTILIVCDICRCVVVLGFLLVRDAGDAWLVYFLSFVQLTLSTFFKTAAQCVVGTVVTRDEVVTANALQGITWSVMLSLGALLGGLVTGLVGRRAAFCIDALSYLLSAAFVARVALPCLSKTTPEVSSKGSSLGLKEAVEGLRYVLGTSEVREVVLVKAGWGIVGGGAMLLYSVFGERVFPVGDTAAAGIGLLYASRGAGALLGPVVARMLGNDRESSLQRAIALSFAAMLVAYIGFGLAPVLPLAAAFLMVAHMGSSTAFVFSTALLNLRVPDALKGRTFASENLIYTVVTVTSILATSFGMDYLHLSPRVLMVGLALFLIFPVLGFRAIAQKAAIRSGVAAGLDAG